MFSERQLRSLLLVLENVSRELRSRGMLSRYRAPLGRAYNRLASLSFQQEQKDIGRECAARAADLVGRQATGRIWPGRLLTLLVGVERKERLVEALARMGIMTSTRQKTRAARQRYAGDNSVPLRIPEHANQNPTGDSQT